MKKLLTLGVALLVSATVAHAQSGVEGAWTASVDSPNGTIELTYDFDVEADTLTGTVATEMGSNEILNGAVDGDTFSFDTKFNNMTISHNCELSDENTISMEYTVGGAGMGPQQLTLTRAEE